MTRARGQEARDRLASSQSRENWRLSRVLLRVLALAIGLAALFMGAGCIHRAPGTLYGPSSAPLSADQSRLREELKQDVEELSTDIGPRNAGESLAAVLAAERWIVDRLVASGLQPRRDEIDVNGSTVANVEIIFPGAVHPEEIIVIGAHYDTVFGSPGANDNASGVALLLATARRLRAAPTGRTVRIVFFVNEEFPFSFGMQMGSKVYAERARARGDDIVTMIAVDSIGYYTSAPGSQASVPFHFGLFPSTGNFVAFISNGENRRLLDRVVAIFQEQSRFPSVGAATDWKAASRSDHAPFWWQGYPALLMSDTSEGRDPNYHQPTDTADNLNYDDLARVADGFIRTIQVLADGETLAQ